MVRLVPYEQHSAAVCQTMEGKDTEIEVRQEATMTVIFKIYKRIKQD